MITKLTWNNLRYQFAKPPSSVAFPKLLKKLTSLTLLFPINTNMPDDVMDCFMDSLPEIDWPSRP